MLATTEIFDLLSKPVKQGGLETKPRSANLSSAAVHTLHAHFIWCK